MKNFTRLKMAVAALSLTFLGACSSSQYTFAPNTGAYHGQEKKTEVAKTEVMPAATQETAEANVTITKTTPVAQATESAQNGTALVQNLATTQEAAAKEAVSETSEKQNKQSLKQLRKDMKQLKKDIKDGKGQEGLGLSSNVKLLLILGLAFLLVGALLNIGIIYLIGAILLIIALVLLLMEIL